MPYLFAYLLYYATGWSVNPVIPVAGKGLEAIGNGPIASTTQNLSPITFHLGSIPIPCLLHVYWALHAIHVILAGYALWSWWREAKGERRMAIGTISTESESAFPSSGLLPNALRLLPWLLLALLFYLPGVYLEWPADPWEHLRRINEWRILDTVGAHSSWMKSSYFIPYSLLSWCIGLRQLFWLDFYYTGICLLLCWQYYRFSRACGLGERASMVFVIIQALLFGNNIFSFYRYYGISSSIYAQLGAVALTRIFLEWAARGTRLEKTERLEDDEKTVRHASHSTSSASSPSLIAQHPLPQKAPPLAPDFWHLPSALRLLPMALCLLPLIAFNHPQGLGIAGLGIAAVIIWRLIEWKRSALWWLIGGTIIINALFLWLYPRPAIIETYRAQGWLNAWYGFNILDLTSPTGDRLLQITSIFGLVNACASLLLLSRNRQASWLTLTPLAAIISPALAIPFAAIVTLQNGQINTFQRMILAIPFCLSLVDLFEVSGLLYRRNASTSSKENYTRWATRRHNLYSFSGICMAISCIMVLSPAGPTYNRTWQFGTRFSDDLQLHDIFLDHNNPTDASVDQRTITTPAGLAIIYSNLPQKKILDFRLIGQSSTTFIAATLDTSYGNNTPLSHQKAAAGIEQKTIEATADAWLTTCDYPPQFIETIDANEEKLGSVLQSPPGKTSQVLNSAPIPILPSLNYQVNLSVRQQGSTQATGYLAVAWYDSEGKLLQSNRPIPLGAGNPRGWANGALSYFGIVSSVIPAKWTEYQVSFGISETSGIPVNARFLRIGALLNWNAAPGATVQVSSILLKQKKHRNIAVLIPDYKKTVSYNSQAGLLSTHWPMQQVLVDRGGAKEITEAIQRVKENRYDPAWHTLTLP